MMGKAFFSEQGRAAVMQGELCVLFLGCRAVCLNSWGAELCVSFLGWGYRDVDSEKAEGERRQLRCK